MENNTETLTAAVAMTRGEPVARCTVCGEETTADKASSLYGHVHKYGPKDHAFDRGFRILSIDAWREPEGGWQWNAWYDTGERFPRIMIDAKPRAVLRWMRDNGLLSAASAGRMAIDDDGYNIVAVAKGTREPIFAIEYGSEE